MIIFRLLKAGTMCGKHVAMVRQLLIKMDTFLKKKKIFCKYTFYRNFENVLFLEMFLNTT